MHYVSAPLHSKHLLDVPRFEQSTDYTCSISAVQMVLSFYDVCPKSKPNRKTCLDLSEETLMQISRPSKRDGLSPRSIVEFVEKLGFQCWFEEMGIADLAKYIDAGVPVIIDVWDAESEGEDGGHYIVAIGYDATGIIVNDPKDGLRKKVEFNELLKNWFDVEPSTELADIIMNTFIKQWHIGIVISPKV